MSKFYIGIFILLTFYLPSHSQSDLGFGEWDSHLPYQRAVAITQSPSKIYLATDFSVMSVDKEDFSLEFISKVNGLSNIGIKEFADDIAGGLKYDSGTGNIMITYADSDIDVLTGEGTINASDIKNNLGIVGDKRINDIHFHNKIAYLSTGFGVVSYNMETFEFGFTTQMGFEVFSCTTNSDGILYAATEDGIYSVNLNATFNFGDFANWDLQAENVGLPIVYEANDIAFYGGRLFALIDNSVFIQTDGVFNVYKEASSGENIRFLSNDGSQLMIGSQFPSKFQSQVTFVSEEFVMTPGTTTCANFVLDAVQDELGRVWYADEWNGFKYSETLDGDCRNIVANSPFSHTVSDLAVDDGILYVASGGVTDNFNFSSNRNGVYVLDQGRWQSYREQTNSIFKEEELLNIYAVAPDPNSDKVYFASFFAGVLEANFGSSEYQVYNSANSPIRGTEGLPDLEKVSGLAFDDNGVLWITLYEAEKPLVALTPEGTFHSFAVQAPNRLGQITVDDFGNKWIQVVSSGVLVYNDNGAPENPSLHQQRLINSSNSNLRTNNINCIAKDLDGDIWIGTAQGPIIFSCGGAVFTDTNGENNCIGTIKTVDEDGILGLLLITEDVRSIEVDGGNQKWIGTRNGIFVQSPQGTDKIARFTAENSPLFNDNIIDMAFDGESGIMYIASDRGLQSYRTTTTDGGRFHQTNAYAFPNPVRPDFEGLIAFKGLPRDARIKVTDIQGQLVFESTALGGQATWDGRDYSGRKVSSGVYLVFSNSRDNSQDPDTAVTKVLIVR